MSSSPSQLIILVVLFVGCKSSPEERQLLNDLLEKYQKYERPVANETLPVDLELSLSIQQIIDLDERNQLLKTNIWLNYWWTDANLKWNETQYGGIKDVRIPPGMLWTPDLLMYNSAAQAFDTTYKTNIVVYSSGSCNYIPPGIFQSTCKIDITWFPFDDQNCILKFGSWTYHSGALNLSLKEEPVDTSTYQTNGEWELMSVPAERFEHLYECCEHPFLDVVFTLKIRRRTLYYFSNLILPCVLIASMAVFGFCCPPESGEKITLEITILMSLTFFMNVVSDMQPPSSETPLIGTYFSCIMIMVASSVVCTILVLNYHHRLASNHRMPFWFRAIFLQWLPWLLRMSRPGAKITRRSIYFQNKMRELELGDSNSKSLLANVLDLEGDFILAPSSHPYGTTDLDPGQRGQSLPPVYVPSNASPFSLSNSSSWDSSMEENFGPPIHPHPREHAFQPCRGPVKGPPSPSRNCDPIENELKNILEEIKTITNKIRDEERASALENEWKFAAMVLDRICLIMFTLFTFILSAAVSLAAPHVVVW